MSEQFDSWPTHYFMAGDPRVVTIDGVTFQQRRCVVCLRDFAKTIDEEAWQAVNALPYRFEFLDDHVSHRWRNEPCPKAPLVSDIEDRKRLRK